MAVGPPPFETSFETTGGGVPDADVLAAINKACQRESWSNSTMAMDHKTGKVISGTEFKEKYPDPSTPQELGGIAIHGKAIQDERGGRHAVISGKDSLTYTS
jgi:hypothetical protein